MIKVILISLSILRFLGVSAQCPEKQFLWNKIIYLKDSSDLSPEKKLNEFLKYEKIMKDCDYSYDSIRALLFQRIGAAYFKQSDYDKAIKFVQQAINIISKNLNKPFINNNAIIKNYFILSIIYDSLKMNYEKNVAIDSCLVNSLRLGIVEQSFLYLLYEKVEYLYNNGDYDLCNKYAMIGESATKQYFNTSDSLTYTIDFFTKKILILFLFRNDYVNAQYLLEKKIEEFINLNDKYYVAVLYELLAQVNIKKGNPEKALLFFNKSLKFSREIGDNFLSMGTLDNLGLYLYFKFYHDNKKALFCFQKALVYAKKNKIFYYNQTYKAINVYANIANLYVNENKYDSAFYYFQLAFNQIKPSISEIDLLNSSVNLYFDDLKNIQYVTELVIDKADAFLQQFKYTKNQSSLKEALRIYKIADQFLNKIKAEHSEMQSKLFWRDKTRRLYEHAIEACYILNNTDEAFYFFEKSRAVLLNDELNEQRWVGQDDISQQVQLKKKILKDQAELDTAQAGSARNAELQNALIINKLELEKIQKAIKANNPLYYQSFLDSSFIILKDVTQNILQNHQALIELFTGDSAVYTLVITPEKNYITQVNKADFDATLNTYITHISNLDLLNRQFELFKTTSHHLYQLLFAKTSLPAGRIIISPDGRNFPFESLIASEQNEKLSYFLYNHAVSYTYSARYLLNQFNSNATNTAKDFMGMAPVNYPVNFSLASLPGSINSLQQLQPYFSNANIFTGSNASRNNFLQNFSNYKIIQLYTHATDSSNKGEPAIYFADSILNLSDLIPEHKPITDLIVLSACKTGSGTLYQGEGVFSFNRAFAALGIPASVNNLWSADNASTYRLTELFYKYLAEGLPTDVALQKAKIEFINAEGSREKELPYYWAATVLAGKTNTIEFNKPFPWAVLLIAIPIAGIALWNGKKILKIKRG